MKNKNFKKLRKIAKQIKSKKPASLIIDTINIGVSTKGSFEKFTIDDLFAKTNQCKSSNQAIKSEDIKATFSETLEETSDDLKEIKKAQEFFLKNSKPSQQ